MVPAQRQPPNVKKPMNPHKKPATRTALSRIAWSELGFVHSLFELGIRYLTGRYRGKSGRSDGRKLAELKVRLRPEAAAGELPNDHYP